jgi:hypothetical protein
MYGDDMPQIESEDLNLQFHTVSGMLAYIPLL